MAFASGRKRWYSGIDTLFIWICCLLNMIWHVIYDMQLATFVNVCMVNLYCMSLHLVNWVEITVYSVLQLSDEEVVCCLLIDTCHAVQKIIRWSLGRSTWCPTPFTTHSCGAQDKGYGLHMNVWWGKVLGAPRDGVPPPPNNYLVWYISSCMLHTYMVPPMLYGVT